MSRTTVLALAAALALSAEGAAARPAPSPVAAQSGPAAGSAAADTASAIPEPGSELRVWLVTMAPGDAVWERFGHNAIRVLDTSTGRDVAYNWGIFSFDQPGFVARFLKGEMLYMMAPFRSGPMVEAYARTGREVIAQELALTPAQRAALRDYAEWNALPQNREYRYDYFRDNCSTRVRDLLDRVLGGELERAFASTPSGTSYRWQDRRLTQMDPWLFTGMDVLLGSPGDREISVWEEMFLPMTLRDAVRGVRVPDGAGGERPLVASETVAVPSVRPPDPPAPPRWLPWYLLLGVALGGALAWTGARAAAGARWGRWTFGALGAAWSLLAGFVGTLLVLVLMTDHVFMYRNENLFLAEPLSLALALVVPLAVRRAGRRARGVGGPITADGIVRSAERIALVVAVLAALGVVVAILPVTAQDNAIFLALATPAHLGLWWGVRALARATAASKADA